MILRPTAIIRILAAILFSLLAIQAFDYFLLDVVLWDPRMLGDLPSPLRMLPAVLVLAVELFRGRQGLAPRLAWGGAWLGLALLVAAVFIPATVFLSLIRPTALLVLAGMAISLLIVRAWRPVPAVFLLVVWLLGTSHAFQVVVERDRSVDLARLQDINRQPGVVGLVTYGWGTKHAVDVLWVPKGASEPVTRSLGLAGQRDNSILYYLSADPSGRFLYASGKGDRLYPNALNPYLVFRYDLSSGALVALPVPTPTQGIHYDDSSGNLWIGNEISQGFYVIPAEAFDRPAAYARELAAFGDRPRPPGEQPGDLFAWYPERRDLQVIVPDPERNRMLFFFEAFSDWREPAADQEASYHLSTWRIDPVEPLQQVPLDGACLVVPSPATGNLYTHVGGEPPGVVELDGDTLEIRRTMAYPFGFGMDVDPVTGDIFLVQTILGSLHRIDPAELESRDSLFIGFGLKLVVYDSFRELLYIGNYFTGDFHIVSWEKRKVLATVDVGTRNRSIVIDPVSRRVFTSTQYGLFEIHVDTLLASEEAQ